MNDPTMDSHDDQKSSFHLKSYELHSDHFKEYAGSGELADHAKKWLLDDTVDAWRHQRMYKLMDPVLEADPGSTWLTVGDGRFGRDSKEIEKRGGVALASDISEHLLAEAKSIGYIKEYRIENAESLSFEENSFDYVFCKESFHHFPRPVIALYEMIRVCKKGVLLIEPFDLHADTSIRTIFFQGLKNGVKFFLGRKRETHFFETSGNYVYTLSKREIEKVALGLGLRMTAFAMLNDSYVKGAEDEKQSACGPLSIKIKRQIFFKNVLSAIGLVPHELMATLIFKETPDEKMIELLNKKGYELSLLPANPYLK